MSSENYENTSELNIPDKLKQALIDSSVNNKPGPFDKSNHSPLRKRPRGEEGSEDDYEKLISRFQEIVENAVGAMGSKLDNVLKKFEEDRVAERLEKDLIKEKLEKVESKITQFEEIFKAGCVQQNGSEGSQLHGQIEGKMLNLEKENNSLKYQIHKLQVTSMNKQVIIKSFEEDRLDDNYCEKVIRGLVGEGFKIQKKEKIFDNGNICFYKVYLESEITVIEIMSKKHTLKGRRVFVEYPLTDVMREKQRAQLSNAKEIAKGQRFKIIKNTLSINEDRFTWNSARKMFEKSLPKTDTKDDEVSDVGDTVSQNRVGDSANLPSKDKQVTLQKDNDK